MTRTRILVASALAVAAALSFAPAADAHPAAAAHPSPAATRSLADRAGHARGAGLGTTTVTTAPGIATTLLGAGILPLPVFPRTGFSLSLFPAVQVSYGFPITSSTADLAKGTGDIRHAGGIDFVSFHSSLEIGKFDISLATRKVYATEVDNKPGRVAVLDLDLSHLSVTHGPGGSTVLSNIPATLDGQAAGALNATFHTALPTNGSLRFGSAVVSLS